MPSGLVNDHHRMSAGVDGCADLGKMRLHGVSVTPGHDQTGALAFGGADRTEDVGPLGALIVRHPRPCPAPGPSAGDLVLLAYAGFVLPPQLYLDALREPCSDLRQFGGKVFLNASIASSF